MRLCPKGDDPFSEYTDYRTITVTTGGTSGTIAGNMKFTFNGEYFYFTASATSWDASACETSFESLKNVKDVSCTQGTVDGNDGALYMIEFGSFPLIP
jgi:hypothetical protein